jgi:hypothetical protein
VYDQRRKIELLNSLEGDVMARKSNEAPDREALKKEQRAKDAAKAVAQYEAEGKAVHEKTARLRALRLAKQAADDT